MLIEDLQLFPSECKVALIDRPTEQELFPEEMAIAEKIPSDKVRDLFTMGRQSARECCEVLGHRVALPRAEGGDVIWPKGLCGSLSHTTGRAVACVGSLKEVRSLGIDVERMDRVVNPAISRKICAEDEWSELSDTWEDALLKSHCVKEAYYKAIYPLSQTFFGFLDVRLKPLGDNCGEVRVVSPERVGVDLGNRVQFKVVQRAGLLWAGVSLPAAWPESGF